MGSGWAGVPCIIGPTARSACTRSIACWASRCCNTCIGRPKRHGPASRWRTCWKSCVRSRNLSCSTPRKVTRGQTGSPPCSPNRRCRSKPWPKRWAWSNCVLPRVGNTADRSQPVTKTRPYAFVLALPSKTPARHLHGRFPGRPHQTPSARDVLETGGLPAVRPPVGRSQTLCRDMPRSGAGTSLLIFFLFEESPQIDAADGGSGGIKTVAHLDLLAHLLDQSGRNVEGFWFPLDEHGNLILRMQVLAVGAMAIGPATRTFAFDKGAREHLAERTEAADEPAARFQLRVAGHFYLTLIIVSEQAQVKDYLRFAKMPQTNIPWERYCGLTTLRVCRLWVYGITGRVVANSSRQSRQVPS